MESDVTRSQANDIESGVTTTIAIRVRSANDCAVETCEPKVKRGDEVTFVLTDPGKAFRCLTVSVDKSMRPLLLNEDGTSADTFTLEATDSRRTFRISHQHPSVNPADPRHFDVKATFDDGPVNVCRPSSCFSSMTDDGTFIHGHTRPRMIVVVT